METNRHHILFPRNEYKAPIERRTRSMGAFIINTEISAHKELHANVEPPVHLSMLQLHDLYSFMQDRYNVEGTNGLEWAIIWADARRLHDFGDNLSRQLLYIEKGFEQ